MTLSLSVQIIVSNNFYNWIFSFNTSLHVSWTFKSRLKIQFLNFFCFSEKAIYRKTMEKLKWNAYCTDLHVYCRVQLNVLFLYIGNLRHLNQLICRINMWELKRNLFYTIFQQKFSYMLESKYLEKIKDYKTKVCSAVSVTVHFYVWTMTYM